MNPVIFYLRLGACPFIKNFFDKGPCSETSIEIDIEFILDDSYIYTYMYTYTANLPISKQD